MRLAKHHARLLVIAVCACVAGAVATAGGAEDSNLFRQRADDLRSANHTLANRLHGAVLDLYSLDAEVDRAQSDLPHSSLVTTRSHRGNAQSACVSTQHDKTCASLRGGLRSSCTRCTNRTRRIRSQSSSGPNRWKTRLRHSTISHDPRRNIRKLPRSRAQRATRSNRSRAELARESAKIRALEADAARTAASLEATRTERRRYIASLAAERNLNETQIARLDSRAQASVERSLAVSAAASAPTPTPTPSEAEATPAPGLAHTLTVVATGYAASGATATGLSTGWGTSPLIRP